MITIVRLKDYAPRQNFLMRSYTSSFGNLYREGNKGFRRVDNLAEVNELRQIPQFEIHQFGAEADLEVFLDGEAQKTYARQGVATKPPVSPVQSTEKIDRDFDDAKRARISEVLSRKPSTQPIKTEAVLTEPSTHNAAPTTMPQVTDEEETPSPAEKQQATPRKPQRRKTKRK